MQTINCGLKIDEYFTGVGTGITPAEVLVLTQIHARGADRGIYPVIVNPIMGEEVERTKVQEFERLKRKYNQMIDGDPKKNIVTQLFPIAEALPMTFDELDYEEGGVKRGLKISIPLPKEEKSETVEEQAEPKKKKAAQG